MTTSYKLLVLPGDGIGPEVMNEVLKVVSCIEDMSSVNFEIVEKNIKGISGKSWKALEKF